MSKVINDGGPAFPNVPSDPGFQDWETGMSLRDYFAAHASEDDIECFAPKTVGDAAKALGIATDEYREKHQQITRITAKYAYADAMIAIRGKQP